MSPETQTFVSTTARSAGPPHLHERAGDVGFDLVHFWFHRRRDPTASLEKRAEALSPLVLSDHPNMLGAEPRADGLPDQLRHAGPTLRPKALERSELLVGKVDVRSAKHVYTIHRRIGAVTPSGLRWRKRKS